MRSKPRLPQPPRSQQEDLEEAILPEVNGNDLSLKETLIPQVPELLRHHVV
jgi:hypothetical protein